MLKSSTKFLKKHTATGGYVDKSSTAVGAGLGTKGIGRQFNQQIAGFLVAGY